MSAKISGAGGPSLPDDEPGARAARVEGEAHVRPGEEGDRFAALNTEFDSTEDDGIEDALMRPLNSANKPEWVAYADACEPGIDHSTLSKIDLIAEFGNQD